jgi:hypothetical protein
MGTVGSSVISISGRLLRANQGNLTADDLQHRLIQSNNNDNNQIANKRYIPKE